MHKPSRDDLRLLLFALVAALIIMSLSLALAHYAYDHNWWIFAH
jgi:hypothetical protein